MKETLTKHFTVIVILLFIVVTIQVILSNIRAEKSEKFVRMVACAQEIGIDACNLLVYGTIDR